MKTFSFLFFSLLLTFGDVDAQFDETSAPLLRRTQSNKRRRASKHPCVVIFSDKEYIDHRVEDQPLECELQSSDITNATEYSVVKVKGMTTKWARKNAIESGVTTLFASNSVIDDITNELIIPTGNTIKLGRHNKKSVDKTMMNGSGSLDPSNFIWNRKLASVVKKVLVLRIQAADAATTASETQLTDDVFGAAGDVLNLKSQFNQCSYGQLQFEPVTSNAIVGTDGVYTVTLPTTYVTGAADNPIAWAAVDKATAELGTLTSFADHVMVCMPPGTSGGWIAYAYINHWLSVFNNEWCGYPSGLLHEFGHNLNLAHSSEGTSEYGDQSGLMGYSYGNDDGPIMCFNGPKTWQLGWFSAYHVDLSIATGISWTGNLIGFAQRADAALTDKMIIRIQSGVDDVYVSFNRRIGINSGTQEGADQVLVATRATGTGYALSYLQAKLSANGIYTVPNFNGSSNMLRIIVNSIVTSATPSRANVSIDLVAQTPAPTTAPTNAPTRVPTQSPTQVPTQSPTRVPTQSPTRVPTQSPTQAPTQAPTQSPTQAPTQSPTQSPTKVPTQSPTEAPTGAPTEAPTTAPPTEAPTQAPTSVPTQSPTETPTEAPTPAPPTEAPTESPTGVPTESPTEAPTQSPTEAPSGAPTEAPTPAPPTEAPTPAPPTEAPTQAPTESPTDAPTGAPTEAPTPAPPTEAPTQAPTGAPTQSPTETPTEAPTHAPTQAPTESPTHAPTELPTQAPTRAPTGTPTQVPTGAPTQGPTGAPTQGPTGAPTGAPTQVPTRAPTGTPTLVPTGAPTQVPTGAPTGAPTQMPTGAPTQVPTSAPTGAPTQVPTGAPTGAPTQVPTRAPTGAPTRVPTGAPTQTPTRSPTQGPTSAPTKAPTLPPTASPTFAPTKAPTAPPTPTRAPTAAPTLKPTTRAPTTRAPTLKPTTRAPTTRTPTLKPTTRAPTTRTPTLKPTTRAPTSRPTTRAPTVRPTTRAPTSR